MNKPTAEEPQACLIPADWVIKPINPVENKFLPWLRGDYSYRGTLQGRDISTIIIDEGLDYDAVVRTYFHRIYGVGTFIPKGAPIENVDPFAMRAGVSFPTFTAPQLFNLDYRPWGGDFDLTDVRKEIKKSLQIIITHVNDRLMWGERRKLLKAQRAEWKRRKIK
ncbi:hypothetical protein FAZ19_19690 [Sphingobacterium alkalisoli]|uniref:Uncharacterized protein n=1 Tax=Sphingobacterium alkalisoli TaxID=1874115 RepID=A0A4U0GVT0_9SPHI|nr:hypothetical protein [Sphingobacterium alkalisoli]TJY62694.1 hypothetical protein FAZ19_19690 [Sphingobacterium alkalisoli]GGH28255.1 hypothetical protein GCM10011418_38780 [Sphingobacterium alkalisoli]